MSGNPYNNEYAQIQEQKQAYDRWLAQKQAYEQWQIQNQAYEQWQIQKRAEDLKEQRKKQRNERQGNSKAQDGVMGILHGGKINPAAARQAVIMSEIIGKPLSKRNRGR